jgi:glutathione S-transferase
MAIKMYDLAGSDNNRRFSPFCWRTKMALAHKGLEVETIPWHFTEKNVIAFAGSERVPVTVDGSRAVKDSWAIANYLEDTYPDRPSLFGGTVGRALSRFYNTWADGVLHPGIARLIVKDICEHIGPADVEYFRKDREARFGMKLEEVCAGREERLYRVWGFPVVARNKFVCATRGVGSNQPMARANAGPVRRAGTKGARLLVTSTRPHRYQHARISSESMLTQ